MFKGFLFFLLFTAFSCLGQQYNFNRVLSQGYSLKFKGYVIVSDTLITIKQDTTISKFKVNIISDINNSKSWKYINENNSDFKMRFSFNCIKNTLFKKNEECTFIMEVRDDFTGSLNTVIYPLISNREE